MRTVGIICEYNPFHAGHKHQIDFLRGMGYDTVVCVMSGNFTQRGELAVFDKYTRAKCAILGGADIVFELPFPYCSMSAEGFAAAGVHILGSLGIKDICFGSECADLDMLIKIADTVLSEDFIRRYSEIQKNSSRGAASAYFEVLSDILGIDDALLSNDILAISYICAIKRLGYEMNIIPIKREGAAYKDTVIAENTLPSASALRRIIEGDADNISESLAGLAPNEIITALNDSISRGLDPVWESNIGRELLSFFKLLTPDEICARAVSRSGGGKGIAQDGCGIIDRLCKCAHGVHDFDGFIKSAYNAKYTDARINRVLLFSAIGVSDKFNRALPEYTTVLAADRMGRELLANLRKACDFPIVTKPADAVCGVQTSLLRVADELYANALRGKIQADYFIKCKPYMPD